MTKAELSSGRLSASRSSAGRRAASPLDLSKRPVPHPCQYDDRDWDAAVLAARPVNSPFEVVVLVEIPPNRPRPRRISQRV